MTVMRISWRPPVDGRVLVSIQGGPSPERRTQDVDACVVMTEPVWRLFKQLLDGEYRGVRAVPMLDRAGGRQGWDYVEFKEGSGFRMLPPAPGQPLSPLAAKAHAAGVPIEGPGVCPKCRVGMEPVAAGRTKCPHCRLEMVDATLAGDDDQAAALLRQALGRKEPTVEL